MSIIIPTLIGFLRPTQLGTLHDVALQLLLKFVAASPVEFKQHLSSLSEYERQVFETSVRQNFAAQQEKTIQKADTPVKVAAPIKLDFSKYQ